MELTNRIAKGERINVYQCGDQAVKQYHPDYPKTQVLYEALVQAMVEETGLPVPKVTDVGIQDGQWLLSMDLIEGKTMYDMMKEDPVHLADYVEQMVDLHLAIHSKRVPMLNKLKDRLIQEIKELDQIDDTRRYELLTRLDSMPKHVKLCHGNFDPRNIIVRDGKIYVIDWLRATQGNASADVGRTYLLLSLEFPEAANLYLDTFCRKTNTAKKYVQDWLPIVAAAHLKESRPEERELLMKWLDVVDYE